MNTCTPSKDFKKHGHKNAIIVIKHKNTTAPPFLDFLTTPCTASK
jgi:hypothetical protein